MSTVNTKLVTGLRTYLRSLSMKRNNTVVTADDAHNYLNRKGVSTRNINGRLSLINSALSTGFEPVGSTPSTRAAAKGRAITEWAAQ